MTFADDSKPGPTDLGLDPKSFLTTQQTKKFRAQTSSDSSTEAMMAKRESIKRIWSNSHSTHPASST